MRAISFRRRATSAEGRGFGGRNEGPSAVAACSTPCVLVTLGGWSSGYGKSPWAGAVALTAATLFAKCLLLAGGATSAGRRGFGGLIKVPSVVWRGYIYIYNRNKKPRAARARGSRFWFGLALKHLPFKETWVKVCVQFYALNIVVNAHRNYIEGFAAVPFYAAGVGRLENVGVKLVAHIPCPA